MIIGIPKEVKSHESRVGMTPGGAEQLINSGHIINVQSGAGNLSGFSDRDYKKVGCKIIDGIEKIYSSSEMIIKVKEPIDKEYNLIRPNQVIFTFFHFASSEKLTRAMIESKAVCIAYETVEDKGNLPLLIPMSEVAGRMATQQGAKLLEKPQKGYGILLGGVPGVEPANVLIIGGGIVGSEAAKMAAGMGAKVTILDKDLNRLRYLDEIMPSNVTTLYSNGYHIHEQIKKSHLIIGSVLVPGTKAPKLITSTMLKEMMPGTVLVDVAIDQGGCFETSVPTTHGDPIKIIDGIVHYAVTNMPGAVPNTSTNALTNATLDYALELANKGWKNACIDNEALAKGLNIVDGKIVYKEVANAFNLKCEEIKLV
ncbi:MAG: alanine dehydrogenase [Bacteroidota bacterium]|nr:alanine dehydrogenase [Bacteroidota bacterium]